MYDNARAAGAPTLAATNNSVAIICFWIDGLIYEAYLTGEDPRHTTVTFRLTTTVSNSQALKRGVTRLSAL